MKISTLGEARNSVVYYSREKQDCIADLFYNYQNCTEKRKNFWNDLRESLVKSYKSMYDAMTCQFREMKLMRNPGCEVCGQ